MDKVFILIEHYDNGEEYDMHYWADNTIVGSTDIEKLKSFIPNLEWNDNKAGKTWISNYVDNHDDGYENGYSYYSIRELEVI